MKRAKWTVLNMAWDWTWGPWYCVPSISTFPGVVWWWFSNGVAQQHLCVAFLWLQGVPWVVWHGYQLYTSMSHESGMQMQLILLSPVVVCKKNGNKHWGQPHFLCSATEHLWIPETRACNEFVKYRWLWECTCSGSDSNVLSPAWLGSRLGLHINISSGLTTGEKETFIKSS